MKQTHLKNLTLTAIFSVLTFCATFIIRIPSFGGYLNFGDCMVLVSGYILGPYWGSVSAGIGSALADVFSGYTIYALPTLIIKAFVAFSAGFLFKLSKKKNILHIVICGIIGEIIMLLGYFIFEAYFLGLGVQVALMSAYSGTLQALAGVSSSTLLLQAFKDRKKGGV